MKTLLYFSYYFVMFCIVKFLLSKKLFVINVHEIGIDELVLANGLIYGLMVIFIHRLISWHSKKIMDNNNHIVKYKMAKERVLLLATFVIALTLIYLPYFGMDKNLERGLIDNHLDLNRDNKINYWELKCNSNKIVFLNNYHITDISALKHLNAVEDLHLSNNNITSLEPLQFLKNLRYLDLSFNRIIDIQPIDDLTELVNLRLTGNKIVDIGDLAGLEKLEYLSLTLNSISSIGGLSENKKIVSLSIDENNVNDLSPLKSMNELQNINIRNNPIQTYGVLLTCQNLRTIYGIESIEESLPFLNSGINIYK